MSAESALRPTAVRAAFVLLGLAALAAWIFLSFGHLGFNPMDEGYILAQAHRVLRGDVPHRDFIVPTPAGSALLHTLDFALPLPLLEASRLTAGAEFVLYSALLAVVVFGRGLGRWQLPHVLGAAAATLVNLHTFPLMAWHTVDGLTLAAAGFALLGSGLDRRRTVAVQGGLFCLGAAVLAKQSFFAAPALGLLLLGARRPVGGLRALAGRLLAGGIVAALPGIVYVAVVAARGGLQPMLTQLTNTYPLSPRGFFGLLWSARERWRAVGLGALCLVVLAAMRLPHREGRRVPRLLVEIGLVALGTAGLLAVPLAAELMSRPLLGPVNPWGHYLTWMLFGAALLDLAARRIVERPALVLLGLAWMVTLSYGYPVPNLVAGSIALYLVTRLWRDGALPRLLPVRLARGLATAAAACCLLVIGRASIVDRARTVYFDRAAPGLTERLNDLAPGFGRIRTNPTTATYLRQLARCVGEQRTTRVAVVPDNAFIYPVFGLQSPFPVTWMYPNLIHGSEERLLDVARRLATEGDYAVLFETFAPATLALKRTVPQASPDTPVFARTSLEPQMAALLSGERTACGSFVLIRAPARSR